MSVSKRSRMAFPVAGAALALGWAGQAGAVVYNGNGAGGFGGPVGSGALTVTDSGSGSINFSFVPGVSFGGNDLVLYLDTVTGGVGSTSTLTDNADGGRTAVSGLGSNGRTLATFAPGFGADFAVSFEPGFAGLFDLSNAANFPFVASGGLTGSGTGPFTFSFTRAQLGLGATNGFSFEGSLISTSGYRSDETIGTSVTVPGSLGDTPNAGFTGTQVFATANTFPAVPEPTALAAVAVAAVGIAGRRRRVQR